MTGIDGIHHGLEGACAMACWVIGMCFLRYWRNSRDRLFVFFVAAFWTFALAWAGLAVLQPADDTRHWFYAVRLLAFVLIIIGVVDKNRRS